MKFNTQKTRDNFLTPLANIAIELDLSANNVSILSIVVLFLSSMFFEKFIVVSGLLMLLYSLLNGIDGCVARITNKVSKYGEILNKISNYSFILVLPLLSLYVYRTEPSLTYIFGISYILTIILKNILNEKNYKLRTIIDIRYLYFVLMILFPEYLNKFYAIMTIYYSICVIALTKIILESYQTSHNK